MLARFLSVLVIVFAGWSSLSAVCHAGFLTGSYADGANVGVYQLTATGYFADFGLALNWWAESGTLEITSSVDSNKYVGVYRVVPTFTPPYPLYRGAIYGQPTGGISNPVITASFSNVYYSYQSSLYLDAYGLLFEGPGSSYINIFSLANSQYTSVFYTASEAPRSFTYNEFPTLTGTDPPSAVPEPASCFLAAWGVAFIGLKHLRKRRLTGEVADSDSLGV
jgi:hypothetical protein